MKKSASCTGDPLLPLSYVEMTHTAEGISNVDKTYILDLQSHQGTE